MKPFNPFINYNSKISSKDSYEVMETLLQKLNQYKNENLLNTIYSQDKNKNIEWYKYFNYQKPINLLFSTDHFLFEFLKKVPQRKKTSEFKLQLKEKKKLKIFYGSLSAKQFTKALDETKYYPGYFSKNLLSYLEHRLDIVLYRSNFVKNINQARQFITHKKILVNNSIITNPSYSLKPGDIISIDSDLSKQLRENLKKNVQINTKESKYLISEKIVDTLFFNQKKDIFQSNEKKEFYLKKQIHFFLQLLIKKFQKRVHFKLLQNPYEKLENLKNFIFFNFSSKNQAVLKDQGNKKPLIVPVLNNLEKRNVKRLDFQQKKNKVINSNNYYYRNIFFNLLVGTEFQKLSQSLFFFKLRKFIQKESSKKKLLKSLQFYGEKPLHLEISYKLMKIIFLYSPQRIYYPFYLDIDTLKRSKN